MGTCRRCGDPFVQRVGPGRRFQLCELCRRPTGSAPVVRGPLPVPPAGVLTVTEAVESGDYEAVLRALIYRNAVAMDDPNTPASALVSLSKVLEFLHDKLETHLEEDDLGTLLSIPGMSEPWDLRLI